jgi:sugar O-acyltransferase (sialic acid O-acetyltransferase NeuD family)
MNKPEIILVGGGGHCKSCIEVIEAEGIYDIKGIIDLPNLLGSSTMGYQVIGNDDDLPKFVNEGHSFLITMGHMGNAKRRNSLYELISSSGGKLPAITAPSAFVSRTAHIAPGSIIMHQAVLNSDSVIGDNSIINNKALIEHDVKIGKHCHISTSASINGDCSIGEHAFIGSGTIVKNGTQVSDNIIIGAGSLVIKDLITSGTYFGSPAKKQKS